MKIFFTITLVYFIISYNNYSYSQLPEQVEIILQPGPQEGKDAYINSAYVTKNGDTPSFIAAAWFYYSNEGIGRSLIEFDLPELPFFYENFSAFINFHHDPNSSHDGHYVIMNVRLKE